MGFKVIIPARHASTRLPGKPLADIAGKPMIQHVYERGVESGAEQVIIAPDDRRVMEAARRFGAEACLTSAHHQSGSDRLAEVIDKYGEDDQQIIVNLQGDEPLMPPALIRHVEENLALHHDAGVATLCERIQTTAVLFDPHIVKVVMDCQGYALYFSRAAIAWDRDAFAVTTEELPQRSEHYRHIGLYAYRCGFLRQYVQWPPCGIEIMESLEQLRVLWNGQRIHVAQARVRPGQGVYPPADLDRVNNILLSTGKTG